MSNRLVFLGTGPITGVQKRGKSNRTETSTLVKTDNGNILIDVSGDFNQQLKFIDRIDVILITHGHQDAIGGIAQLRKFIKHPISVYTLPKTIKIIQKKFKQLEHLKFYLLPSLKPFRILDIKIIPFEVKHSIQPGFPTLGFKFYFPNKYILTYISDTGGWDNKVQNLISGSDLLILDGAMWGKKLVSHLDIKEILSKVKNWGVGRVIFTQIGNTAPEYKELNNTQTTIFLLQPAFLALETLVK